MSGKTSKRRQKRLNTNDEELEISEKSVSPKKINDPELNLKDDISEHSETDKTDATEEQNGHKIEENGNQNGNGDHHDSKNGFHETVNSENGENNHEIIDGIVIESANDDVHSDDIHLSIDVTPEKEIQTQNEREKSPVLTGMTTRSHRNSPKVEKMTENGMDPKLTCDVQVNLKPIIEETVEKCEMKKSEEEYVKNEDTKVEETKAETETDEKDTTNASIFVNVGNDTTNLVDITTTSVVEEQASYLDTNKDVPYPQAIRTLSGRRALRRDSPFVPNRGKSHLEKDLTDSRRSYVPHISSVKRKNTSELPDDSSKRYKTEGSPGILSYISSPLTSFRNRLSRSELPSSTPKLTSYNKYGNIQGNNIIEDMSQIDLAEEATVQENTTEPTKKWCAIM